MKKPVTVAALTCALLFTLSGCMHMRGVRGSGVRKTEKRELASFTAIDASGAYDIEVNSQKTASFEIEGDDNILPLIKTEVRNGVLLVRSDERYSSSKSIQLRISMPDLTSMSIHGAGEVKIADVNNDHLKIDSTGAASITAAGKSKSIEISSSGAGDINAGALQAQKVSIHASGAASIDVFASDQLDVSLSGVGSVTYRGNPKVVNKNVSGLGSINKKEAD